MSTRVRSYSKINLGLSVGPARPDGFHELLTIYQTLEAHDLVTVSAREAQQTRITVRANHPGVPRTETGNAEQNTAYRIVELALQSYGVHAEVEITIDKRLPVQGGLGAGSGNAAAALIAFEMEIQRLHERLGLGEQVGSDVPLFFLGGTVLGKGRGEIVTPLEDLRRVWCVLATPDLGVSTAKAFQALDAQMAAHDLKYGPEPDRLARLSRLLSSVLATSGLKEPESGTTGINPPEFWAVVDLAADPLRTLVRTGIENDFEEVVFSEHPSLREIKHALEESRYGDGKALYAALSGSGSTLFALFEREEDAREAQQRVHELGTRTVLTRTMPRNEYWHTMFAE